MNLLTAVLLQIWQLPQNLVGLVFGWLLRSVMPEVNITDGMPWSRKGFWSEMER